VVSGDGTIEASATMIVGIIFLVSLRQALRLKVTRVFFSKLIYPVLLFAVAGICAVVEGSHPNDWIPSRFFFILGMISVVVVVFYFQRELEERENAPGSLVRVRKM
jgi:hypothetical protein